MTQLRCSECESPIEGVTEEEAECASDDVECERCFYTHMGWPDAPEEELPFEL